MASKKRKLSPMRHSLVKSTEGGAELQGLLQWLRAKGAEGVDDLEYRASSETGGGLGVFTKKTISPGGSVAKIPQSCVLTAEKALSSALGRACVAVNPHCTDEFIFTLWVAAGRLDTTHPFHAYLSSLPRDCTSPLSWPEALVDSTAHLGGTNLGGAVVSHNAMVRGEYAGLLERIERKKPGLLPHGCDIDLVAWAHDMYVSRRFPLKLAVAATATASASATVDAAAAAVVVAPREFRGTCSKLTESLGVMLPLFDLLNHQPGTDIDWSGDAAGVTFSCGQDLPRSLPAGAEVFNNYGNKGNESLMMAHGFCTHDNLYDSYGLKLLMRTTVGAGGTGGADGEVTNVGVFRIYRNDNPDVLEGYEEQIPVQLWKAISNPTEYIASATGGRNGDEDNDEGSGSEIAIEAEDVELLLATVQKHLTPYARTKKDDLQNSVGISSSENLSEEAALEKMREVFIARYRDGQRKVLEGAVFSLQEMLLGIGEEEEEEEEEEGM